MAGPLPTADDVIALVKDLIGKLGTDAFKTNGRIQLYSGPKLLIATALRSLENNHYRAFAQAARSAATLIDNTEIGQQLEHYNGVGIYEYFEKQYEKVYGPDSPEAFAEADKVMRFTSRAFIRASFGHVATAVCGADTRKIFYEEELPEMIKNGRIETVNSIPAQTVNDFFAISADEAFRLICLAELMEARSYAKRTGDKDAKQDYRERLQFFVRERHDTRSKGPKTPADHKLLRRRALAVLNLKAIYTGIGHGMGAVISAPMIPPVSLHYRHLHM